MALGTSVRLPADIPPRFPNRCIYSDVPDPDAEAVIVANTQNSLFAFLAPILLLFGWRRVRVPISRTCRARFYLQNYGRDVIMIALSFVAVFAIMPMLNRHDPLRKIKAAGLVLAALSPWIAFEVFLPRRFDVTARKHWIDYEFASAEYATEFAMLNAPHVIRID